MYSEDILHFIQYLFEKHCGQKINILYILLCRMEKDCITDPVKLFLDLTQNYVEDCSGVHFLL